MIVGLGHQARVGKDTIAEHLVANHGFKRLAFADALKGMAYDTNPQINRGTLQGAVKGAGWEEAKQIPEVRQFLQNLGVAAREHLYPDVWVDAVINRILFHEDYVITDVRFPNEFEALEDLGAKMVKVVRPGVRSNAGSHISETALEEAPWEIYVVNDRTPEDLFATVDKVLGL